MKNIGLIGILILLVITNQLSSQIIVAKYNFTGNAQDINGGGYNGIVHGATLTTDRFGNTNSAFQFDGVDDYIEVPYWTPFNFGLGGFAVSVWIKTTNSSILGMIIQKGSTSAYQAPQFWVRCPDPWLNNDLAFLTGNANPPSPYAATDTINIADGNWHHIVAQRSAKQLELYFDCHLVATNLDTYRDISDTVGVIIGAQHTHPNNFSINNYFTGSIDDVTIYDEALSNWEIQFLCSSTNIEKSIEKNKTLIRAFPNPFNNVLQINGEFEYIEIYNLLGVKIKTCSNNKVVNLPNLISGTYICKIYTTNNSIEYLKIVKL